MFCTHGAPVSLDILTWLARCSGVVPEKLAVFSNSGIPRHLWSPKVKNSGNACYHLEQNIFLPILYQKT
jgi:hypothetical protein